MMRVLLLLLALLPQAALAQTCPATGSTPAFTAGGSVFGRLAAQWNTYFGAKVDINNGVLCNPTIIGGPATGEFTASSGLANQVGVRNVGTQTIARTGGTLYGQLWPVLKTASYVVNSDSGLISDHGALLIAGAAGITFTLPNPVAGNIGVTYQFGSDGTNGYTLTTVGGTALITGCTGGGGASLVVAANVDTQVGVNAAGTGYKCTALGGGAVTSVSNADGSLTISPTTGAVVASLNVAHENDWTGTQSFASAKGTTRTVTGTTDTLVATDCGKTVEFTNAGANILTTLAGIVSGTKSCSIIVKQGPAAGAVTIVAGAGATQVTEPGATAVTAGTNAGLGLYVSPNAPSEYVIGGNTVPASSPGTVTSVALSVPAVSIFGATGTPVTTSGTLGMTTTGTSGGVPYFSSGTALSTSAELTANLPVIGGGAGAAPSVGTKSGNTNAYVTTTGAQTSGDCVEIDASGNHIASGGACGGSGTPGGSSGDIQYNNAGAFGGRTPSGTGTSVVTTTGTQTNGDCVKIDANGNHVANGSACGGGSVSALATFPQGRLTLTSGAPVMTADAVAQSTVYYSCYQGNLVPVGNPLTNLTIASCEVSMGLDAGVPRVASGSVYDVFAVSTAGTLNICVGPAWTSTTVRGTGAGTTQIDQANGGIWTNTVSITNCWGGAAGTTDRGVVAAGAGTYLGSIYATANGQTGIQFKPARAAGGSNNIVGLYNAYNQVPIASFEGDSTASWIYGSSTWRTANNNPLNSIRWLDGLKQSVAKATYAINIASIASTNGMIGVTFNSTTATPDGTLGYVCCGSNTSAQGSNSTVLLGLNTVYAMEAQLDNSGNITFFNEPFTGNWTGGLTLEMMN